MALDAAALRWDRDGRDWPSREYSSFVYAGGVRWHVQAQGAGPVLLLIHGTGASTHTWRDVIPRLAAHFRVVALDLPGHAFTERLPAKLATLQGMSTALAALLDRLALKPAAIVGHSAGAAIGARLCLDGRAAPALLVSLNGALLPLEGMPMGMFTTLARVFAATSLVPRFVAWAGNDASAVRRLVDSTGSTLDARGLALYGRLVANPVHVAAVIDMMAGWRLDLLAEELPELKTPLLMITSTNDRTVPPREAERVKRLLPASEIVVLPDLGHLAHEEAAALVSELLIEKVGVALARATAVLHSVE